MALEKFYVKGYDIRLPGKNKRAGLKKTLKRNAHSRHRMAVKEALRRGDDGPQNRPFQDERS